MVETLHPLPSPHIFSSGSPSLPHTPPHLFILLHQAGHLLLVCPADLLQQLPHRLLCSLLGGRLCLHHLTLVTLRQLLQPRRDGKLILLLQLLNLLPVGLQHIREHRVRGSWVNQVWVSEV